MNWHLLRPHDSLLIHCQIFNENDVSRFCLLISFTMNRSISAVFEQETEVRDIHTWRYVGPPSAFANATENPSNAGFCTPDSSHCLPSGMLNVSNCQFGKLEITLGLSGIATLICVCLFYFI